MRSKMQATGATDLAYKDHILSENCSLRAKEETDDQYQSESSVRCFCGSSMPAGTMIKVSYKILVSVYVYASLSDM